MNSVLAELGGEMGRMKKALRSIKVRWEQIRQDWDDPVARRFEQQQLQQIEKATTRAVEGINQVLQALRRAVEECS